MGRGVAKSVGTKSVWSIMRYAADTSGEIGWPTGSHVPTDLTLSSSPSLLVDPQKGARCCR